MMKTVLNSGFYKDDSHGDTMCKAKHAFWLTFKRDV